MKTDNGTKTYDKIEALRQRENALRAARIAEQVKQQKARAKLQAREFATVGEALVKYSAENADFKLMLKQVLASAVTDEPMRKFLRGRGWVL